MYTTTDTNGQIVRVTLQELIQIEELKLIALFAMSSHDPA